MPFKDTKEGQTHSFNDGCGEPEHNDKKDNNDFINPLTSNDPQAIALIEQIKQSLTILKN